MKVRVEFSCVECDLMTAINEVHAMIQVLDVVFVELKVFHDGNRNPDSGHSWLTINRKSYPPDLFEMYTLKKRLTESQQAISGGN